MKAIVWMVVMSPFILLGIAWELVVHAFQIGRMCGQLINKDSI